MIEKHFKFKVSERLCDSVFDYDYMDIVYIASENISNKEEYIIDWVDPESQDKCSIVYHKEFVEECVEDGSWIIITE